jgi:hypothetical protein
VRVNELFDVIKKENLGVKEIIHKRNFAENKNRIEKKRGVG